LQEKVYPQRKFTTVEQLKLAIIDDTEILGSALLIALQTSGAHAYKNRRETGKHIENVS